MATTTPTPFRGSVLLRKALAQPTEPLNQSALALQLGVSQQAVSCWIHGRSRPSMESILELERLFAIPPREWLHPRYSQTRPTRQAPASGSGSSVKEVA